jgi:L-aminopeptidase/D-esterase-like protein
MLPPGFALGHWHDPEAATGCSVILAPEGTVGSCDVRGSSPGSRELALLSPIRKMQEVHALLLTGGSAFGLAAADGVVRYLEERGRGYLTPWARVPIVPAAVVYDLNCGSAIVRPTAESGYRAAQAARGDVVEEGSVGAGMGATVGKWAGIEHRMRGGLGVSSVVEGSLIVTAVAVVNAVGDVLGQDGAPLAGARDPSGAWCAGSEQVRKLSLDHWPGPEMQNTTLVALLSNARLSKVDVHRAAQRGHDGMARAIRPVHTAYDGDIVFALASGQIAVSAELVAELGAEVTAGAIRRAVLAARPAHGISAAAGT